MIHRILCKTWSTSLFLWCFFFFCIEASKQQYPYSKNVYYLISNIFKVFSVLVHNSIHCPWNANYIISRHIKILFFVLLCSGPLIIFRWFLASNWPVSLSKSNHIRSLVFLKRFTLRFWWFSDPCSSLQETRMAVKS